jgi:hypothetical protein
MSVHPLTSYVAFDEKVCEEADEDDDVCDHQVEEF